MIVLSVVVFIVVLLAWLLLNVFLFVASVFNHNLSRKVRIILFVVFLASAFSMPFALVKLIDVL